MIFLFCRKSLEEPRELLLEAAEMLKDETHENLPEGQLRLQVRIGFSNSNSKILCLCLIICKIFAYK